MSDKNKLKYDDDFKLDFNNWEYLGQGHHGIVYLMNDGKIIKICNTVKSCKGEEKILLKVNGSKFFPKLYECGGNYIIREYVDGICMKNYISDHGLNREISKNIIKLLREFKELNFRKIDIRCKDIFVLKDKSLKVIDPRASYSKGIDYPRHLCKGLNKLGVLDQFLNELHREKSKLCTKWYKDIKQYFYNEQS